MNRYRVESFKNSHAKRVPYEQLDFSIYKASANLVAFSTTEQRLPLWIEVMKLRYKDGLQDDSNARINTRWEEQDNPIDSNKCEKVSITLTSKENSETIINITVMIDAGRIQIRGKYFKEWGGEEFYTLVELVNSRNDASETTVTKNFESFVEKIFNTQRNTYKTSPVSSQIAEKQPVNTNISVLEEEPSAMKSSLASLEADFVLFKQNTEKTMTELTSSLDSKDKEIEKLKKELTTLNNKNTNNHQTISDLTLKQAEVNEELKNLHIKCKTLERRNSDLLSKIASITEVNLKASNEEMITPEESNLTTHANIPISNKFDPIANKSPDVNGDHKPGLAIPSSQNQQPNQADQHQKQQPNQVDQHQNQQPNQVDQHQNQQPNHVDQHQNQQPKQVDQHQMHGNECETVILCDSNGRHIKPNLLCPDSKANYIRCPTLPDAKRIIENTTFTSPKTFIIHCGTNDMETNPSNEEIIKQVKDITTIISKKHPQSRTILSSLLPRSDELNERAANINQKLEKAMPNTANVTFVKHENIRKQDLKDKKHLNSIGVKRFAQNLKRAYFNKPGRKNDFGSNHQPSRYQQRPHVNQYRYPHSRYQQHYQKKVHPLPNPYFNYHPMPHDPPQNHSIPHYQRKLNPSPNTYSAYHYPLLHKQQTVQDNTTSLKTNDQSKQDIPLQMIELIKQLHTRYVN